MLLHAITLPDIAFDPLLSAPLIAVLGALGLLAAILGGLGQLRTFSLRALAVMTLTLALLNPQTVIEDRIPLNDVVLVLRDQSESVKVGERSDKADEVYATLIEKLNAQENLDVVSAIIPPSSDGTRLTSTLLDATSNIPLQRFAGVIALTDGQVHDVPPDPQALLPEGVPFHSLIIGDPNLRDRRIRPVLAPKYGLVGEVAEFEVEIDDPGHEGEQALIEVKLNGTVQARFPVIIGERVSLPVEIERRGTNTVELVVEPADDELTLVNNVFVSEFSGIRDRMRVLLVTGFPHNGGRAWRNLLKSDPSVDLVQFTILTNPGEKSPNAAARELSLIAFPTRQLFEEKLDEFDLIIFDQFRRRFETSRGGVGRAILQPYYLQNIAEYVESGGALLVAAGPPFASEESLYRSPLAAVLPTRPTGELTERAFTPELNEKGRRHPITAGFSGREDQSWGEWFRLIGNSVISGDVLMEGADGSPLLVIEKIGRGRVGMLMSDQAWLWAKGYDGGGPYSEMFRRLSHWLMGEPDLAAEKITARVENNLLTVERRTLNDSAQTVFVEKPDGTMQSVTLSRTGDGVYTGTLAVSGQGAYRVNAGDISTVAAAGSLNPKEFADLRPTADYLQTFADSTGGRIILTESDPVQLPEIRRVKAGRDTHSENWMGLVAYEDYTIRNSRRSPLLPGLLFFALLALLIGLAWRREGR